MENLSGRKRKKQIIGHHKRLYSRLVLSSDGSLLVYAAIEERELSLWILHAEGGKSLVVIHPRHNESPNWSPDGKRIAFTRIRSGNFDVWLMDVYISKVKKELQAFYN